MSSGFISETEAIEARQRRQEEWEKVRTDDQPKEAPEEEYDNRPLFQRLEEQRLKKDAEYEETHRLKNMIRGLDDDEVGFLELVERTKATAARQISLEEQREMQEFRERVSSLAESTEQQRLRAALSRPPAPTVHTPPVAARNKLQGVIVRKRKLSDPENEAAEPTTPTKRNGIARHSSILAPLAEATPERLVVPGDVGLRCAGVLPGLGHYSDTTSDSDGSSDIEEVLHNMAAASRLDLCGRRNDLKKKEDDDKS